MQRCVCVFVFVCDLIKGREDNGVRRVLGEADVQFGGVLRVWVGLNGSDGIQHLFKFVWCEGHTWTHTWGKSGCVLGKAHYSPALLPSIAAAVIALAANVSSINVFVSYQERTTSSAGWCRRSLAGLCSRTPWCWPTRWGSAESHRGKQHSRMYRGCCFFFKKKLNKTEQQFLTTFPDLRMVWYLLI